MRLVSAVDTPCVSVTGRVIRTITLSRPKVRNAMNTALLAQLLDAVTDAITEEAVAALVMTGDAGHFSAGADINEGLDRAGRVRRMELFGQVYEAVATCPKATLASVQGVCVGGGAEVAVSADIRVAGPDVSFRFPGAAMGYPVGPAKLIGLVGLGQAKDLVLTGKTITGAEAHRIGIVQRLTPGDPLVTALEVAQQITANHLHAVTYLKAQFDTFSGLGDRVQAENDALHALAKADGDYTALSAPNPKTTSGWSATAWKHR